MLEATREDKEEFGEARLAHVLLEDLSRTPEELRGAVLSAMFHFLGESRLHDDLTLVVARFV